MQSAELPSDHGRDTEPAKKRPSRKQKGAKDQQESDISTSVLLKSAIEDEATGVKESEEWTSVKKRTSKSKSQKEGETGKNGSGSSNDEWVVIES